MRILEQAKVWTRLAAIILVALIGMSFIILESIDSIEEVLMDERKLKTQHVVDVAYSVVTRMQALEAKGQLTREQAQAEALRLIKDLRYDDREYFWVHDLTAPVPRMLMHATVPALDGNLLDDAKFNSAKSIQQGLAGEPRKVEKKNLFVALNEAIAKDGRGFVLYDWPKPKADGGVTERLYTKLSYVKRFDSWGWVVGSGIYIDDVEEIFWGHATDSLILVGFLGSILLAAGFVIARSITRQFGGEPVSAIQVATHVAAGDLSIPVQLRPDDRHSVLYSLSSMQASLATLVAKLRESVSSINREAAGLDTMAQDLRSSTEAQSEATGSTAAAVEQTSAAISAVTDNARQTEADSAHTAELARKGSEVVEETTRELLRIGEIIAEASTKVATLKRRSEEISTISNVIKDIAGQTNLLALNAAIEAARAGEQGRGFAVVADEVRKLAERTTAATAEIESVIAAIQAETSMAVDSIEEIVPKMEESSNHSKEAARALAEIGAATQTTMRRAQEVSTAMQELNLAGQSIAGNVEKISEMTQHTQEDAGNASRTAATMNRLAAELEKLVSGFRI
jgi:methyl-accepting chemotaxis protein